MLFRNAGYRFKLVRVSRGQSLNKAGGLTALNEKFLSRTENGMEESDVDTLVKIVEGYHIRYSGMFKHYDSTPTHAQRKHIDFLSVRLGCFLRRKAVKYLSESKQYEAWQEELERLGGLTDDEQRVLEELGVSSEQLAVTS